MSRDMKYSGNPWIGDIPYSWNVERIKTIFKERTELSEDGSETLLSVSEYYGVANRSEKVSDGEFVSRAETLVGYKKCFVGDLVSNIMLAWKGSMGITEYDGIVSPAYCVYEPSPRIYPRYYHYLFRTSLYTSIFRLYSKGIIDSRLRLYSPYFFDISAIIPSPSEQQKIASFLDRKCCEIDEMIALQEKIIDELKAYKQSVITEAVTKGLNPNVPMKDSGIEWIGEIPEHWEVIKFHRVCNTITDFVASGSFESLRINVPYLDTPDYAMLVRTVDLSGKGRSADCVYISKHSYDFLRNSNLFGGEVILPNIGASVGDVYIVPKLYEKMSLAPNLIMFKTSMCDNFFYYYFFSLAGKQAIYNISQSTAQPKFNKTQLKEIKVCAPPVSEQERIADYLDNKCTEIDNLISIKLSKIDSLKEYKKSIIYEYVTGKKEVI